MQSEEITFIGKRGGALANLAAAAAICAAGVALLALGYTIAGIVLLLGAVAPAIVSLRKALFPPARYLRLDSNGFEVAVRHNRDRIKWDDVAEFRSGPPNDDPVIEVLYVSEYAQQSCSSGDQRFAGRIFDRYNTPLPDVLEKLREWQQRYGHATTPSVGHTTTPSIGHTTTPSIGHTTTPSVQRRTA